MRAAASDARTPVMAPIQARRVRDPRDLEAEAGGLEGLLDPVQVGGRPDDDRDELAHACPSLPSNSANGSFQG